MRREVSLEEISDGKLYTANDMVRADCGDCAGCSACCRGMGTSIVLDPLDVYRLLRGLQTDFDSLLAHSLELNAVDGIVLPNMKMSGTAESCTYLDENGRCGIHPHRPGICRLFPLGRYYENGSFRYFLQTKECRKENPTKVKVKKWIDTPDVKRYEQFVNEWHDFLIEMQRRMESADEQTARQICLFLLQNFYRRPYDTDKEFYPQFEERMKEAKAVFH